MDVLINSKIEKACAFFSADAQAHTAAVEDDIHVSSTIRRCFKMGGKRGGAARVCAETGIREDIFCDLSGAMKTFFECRFKFFF